MNFLRILYRIFYKFCIYYKQLFFSYVYYYSKRHALCCDIRCGVDYVGKKRTKFPHPIGVVIGMGVKLGYDCMIFQNVTLGTKSLFKEDYPSIGNNVIIGANSILVGDIKIGNNVVIGANTFVNVDLPDDVVVAGNPLRMLKK